MIMTNKIEITQTGLGLTETYKVSLNGHEIIQVYMPNGEDRIKIEETKFFFQNFDLVSMRYDSEREMFYSLTSLTKSRSPIDLFDQHTIIEEIKETLNKWITIPKPPTYFTLDTEN